VTRRHAGREDEEHNGLCATRGDGVHPTSGQGALDDAACAIDCGGTTRCTRRVSFPEEGIMEWRTQPEVRAFVDVRQRVTPLTRTGSGRRGRALTHTSEGRLEGA